MLQELESLEEIVRTGWPTFVSVGMALTQIRDKGLHKAVGFRSFQRYCRERLRCCRSTVDRQISAARVATVLKPFGVEIENESQVRPLAGMAEDHIIKVWKKAASKPGQRVTARLIRDAAINLKLIPSPSQSSKIPLSSIPNAVLSLVDQASAAIDKGELSKASALLGRLKNMLQDKTIYGQNSVCLNESAA
jgi:hypothetical protein